MPTFKEFLNTKTINESDMNLAQMVAKAKENVAKDFLAMVEPKLKAIPGVSSVKFSDPAKSYVKK